MNALKIALSIIILFSFLGFLALGLIGYRYYKDVFSKTSTDTSNTAKKKDFASNVVYQPSGTILDLVSKSSPAVVTVVSKTEVQSIFDDTGETEQGVGTGFFISDDGLLITNEHVVCDSTQPDSLTINTSDDKTYSVDNVVVDSVQDIAIVKVNTKGQKVPFLKFANQSSPIKVGQDVIAIGNPLGVNPGSVTKGIVSGIGRNITAQGACQNKATQKEYEGVIQTDAAINGGNSGGPLINLNGEVIGVNSATSVGANNISYSVPFDRVLKLLDRYQKNNGKLTFPYIGVEYTMIDQNIAKTRQVPTGAYVRRVVQGSPADKAGIKKGDIITKIENQKIEFSLQATLSQFFEPNQNVKTEVYRYTDTNLLGESDPSLGRTLTLDLTIGQR